MPVVRMCLLVVLTVLPSDRGMDDRQSLTEGGRAVAAPTFGPQWFVADGSRVVIGSRVRTDFGPQVFGTVIGVDADHGLPIVRLDAGPLTGEEHKFWPGQLFSIRS
ncbi:hypothetical protein AB0B66_09420 [Catellatospora sp. NPDC049111]|uniref:hypothetical protein n=1 Tax=Catellatospora sp. NPDC049111 TaxID=3155271 RepID=UPI0033F47226